MGWTPNEQGESPLGGEGLYRGVGYSALSSGLCSALGLAADFCSGFMKGGSGWSCGREPPLLPFLLCFPRLALTPFNWVMLDTLWYPLPSRLPAPGKPNQRNNAT